MYRTSGLRLLVFLSAGLAGFFAGFGFVHFIYLIGHLSHGG